MIRRDGIEGDFVGFFLGQFVWAYDYPPCYGGNLIAVIRLNENPKAESTSELTDHDYVDEGYAFLEKFPSLVPEQIRPLRKLFQTYQSMDYRLWVIRFEVVELTLDGLRMAERLCTAINNANYLSYFHHT